MSGNHFLNDLLLKGLLVNRGDCEVTDISPCIADETRIKFIAKINRRLENILPVLYLATLNSKLIKDPMILSFTVEQHNFMLGANGDLAVTFVKDEDEIDYIVEKVVDLINKGIKYTMSRHPQLEDMVESKKKLNPMSLYNVFPKTDCKKCGEKSCFNYAAKVFSGELDPSRCPDMPSQTIEKLVTPVNLGRSISFKGR